MTLSVQSSCLFAALTQRQKELQKHGQVWWFFLQKKSAKLLRMFLTANNVLNSVFCACLDCHGSAAKENCVRWSELSSSWLKEGDKTW